MRRARARKAKAVSYSAARRKAGVSIEELEQYLKPKGRGIYLALVGGRRLDGKFETVEQAREAIVDSLQPHEVDVSCLVAEIVAEGKVGRSVAWKEGA